MKYNNPAMWLVAGTLVLLSLLLALQQHVFAGLEPATASSFALRLPDITATPIPSRHLQNVRSFDHLAHFATRPISDEKTASNQVPSVQPSLAPQADCTGVAKGTCVETRAGLSLCNLNNLCVIKADLTRNNLPPRMGIAPTGGTTRLKS